MLHRDGAETQESGNNWPWRSFPESSWGLQPLRAVYTQNTDFQSFYLVLRRFQLLTNSKFPKACNILLLGKKQCSEINSSALSSCLTPSRTGTVRSLVSLHGSALQGHTSWQCAPQEEERAYPLDHSWGLSREIYAQSPDTYITLFSEQDPSIQLQDTERWDAGNKNQWQNLSRVTYFTLVSFMLSLGHCKHTVQQLGWVSPCLISAVWKPSDCSKGCCQHKERETFAGGDLSHASETPTLGSDSSLSGGFLAIWGMSVPQDSAIHGVFCSPGHSVISVEKCWASWGFHTAQGLRFSCRIRIRQGTQNDGKNSWFSPKMQLVCSWSRHLQMRTTAGIVVMYIVI